jgi:hypothetical protein
LGIPADNVRFVFKRELTSTIAKPRFARIWVEILDLPASSEPFSLVGRGEAGSPSSMLFGSPGSFLPTVDDYLSSRVHRAHVATAVEDDLDRQRWALVWGNGASGKTTLALSVALSAAYREKNCYYVSIEGEDFPVAAAAEVIATRADEYVLFIVDNIHLNPRAAASLFSEWKAVGRESRMLLLGRRRDEIPYLSDGLAPFAALEARVLDVDLETMRGAFGRLVPSALLEDTLPPDEVQTWLALFGGDLIVFAAAVSRRQDFLRRGSWRLTPEDAVDYVRERHLLGLSANERINLLRVSVAVSLERGLDSEALEEDGLRVSTRRGIIRAQRTGIRGSVRYFLVHEGIATLILRAADAEAEVQSIACAIARRSSNSGFSMAHALHRRGNSEGARAVLDALWTDSRWPLSAGGLSSILIGTVRSLETISKVRRADLNARIVRSMPGLVAQIVGGNLAAMYDQVRQLFRDYPIVYRSLSSNLVSKACIEHLPEACAVDLQGVIAFLRNTATDLSLSFVHRSWREVLFPLPVPAKLPGWALAAPFGALPAMMSYLEGHRPPWAAALDTIYSSPKQLQRLTDEAYSSDWISLFKIAPRTFGRRIIEAIDIAAWAERETPINPGDFMGCARVEGLTSRSLELLELLARRLIGSLADDGSACEKLPLLQAGMLLRFSRQTQPEVTGRFLDAMVAAHPDMDVVTIFLLCEGALIAQHQEALTKSGLFLSLLSNAIKRDQVTPRDATAAALLWSIMRRLDNGAATAAPPIEIDLLQLAAEHRLYEMGHDRALGDALFHEALQEAAKSGILSAAALDRVLMGANPRRR